MSHIPGAVRVQNLVQPAFPITPPIYAAKAEFPSKTMYCDVVFGSPSMSCSGTGICKITGTNSVQSIMLQNSCHRTSGIISARADGKISLFFFRELLCIKLYRQHFYKGVLEMKESCTLPDGLRHSLGAKKLLPGTYAVIEENGCFRVDVDCV